MARPSRWHHVVIASRDEAITAADILNSPLALRPLEGFLVHMHVAWLYLLQAEFEKTKVDYHYRKPNGRYVRVDGEKKSWDLQQCIRTRWPDSRDPVRLNLDLTCKLRNKIEHRFERGLSVAALGFTQSLIMNYEDEIVGIFGDRYSLAQNVHLPVSLSLFSREGAVAMLKAQEDLPVKFRDFFVDYRAGVAEDIRSDRAFEFRIEVVQKRAPKSDADLAVSYVRADDLDPEELELYQALERTGRIVLHDKHRDVINSGWMKPTEAAREISQQLGVKFGPSSEFPKAWRYFEVRPGAEVRGDDRAKTKGQYCRWDKPFEQYVYSGAFVELVVSGCSSREGFERVIGWAPKPLADGGSAGSSSPEVLESKP